MAKSAQKKWRTALEMTEYSNSGFETDDKNVDEGRKARRRMMDTMKSKEEKSQGFENMAMYDSGDLGNIKVSSRDSPPSKKMEKSKSIDRNKSAAKDARTGRPPTTSVLRSAMYYQNRIIVLDTPETRTKSPSSAHASPAAQSPSGVSQDSVGPSQNAANAARRPTTETDSNSNSSYHRQGHSAAEREASAVTMEARGIDIVVTDTDNKSSRKHSLKKNTIWRRIGKLLQDNRMKGRADAEQILAAGNPDDYRILKKVLNIIFLMVGIALLVAVVIVIIYTTVVYDTESASPTNITVNMTDVNATGQAEY